MDNNKVNIALKKQITMTKYTYIAGFLAAGFALTACSSYDEEDFNESRQRVTTQFSLSVSGKAATRMTNDATQADEQFQGMKDIILIPFAKEITDATKEDPVASTDHHIGTQYALEAIDEFEYKSNSNLYEIEIPTGTNAFLIYGRSKATTNGNILATNLNSHPADITFSPVQIVSSVTSGQAAGEKGDNIIAYLNTIFNANWANKEGYPILNGFYTMVQDMKAGSSASVLAFVQEIYEALKKSPSTAAGVTAAITAIEAGATISDGKVTALSTNCQGYPADKKLPDGVAVIEWDETNHKFVAVTTKNNLGAMNVDVTNFVYPAELWYRTNSRINTDYGSRKTEYELWPTWQGVLDTYVEQYGTVKASTQSIAVRQQMQYAVGRLDVKLSTTGTTLKDKEGTEFALNKLPITGILIGQQSPVDFEFHKKTSTTDSPAPSYTAYDNVIDENTFINADAYTHTLVLETAAEESVNVAVELLNNSNVNIVTHDLGGAEEKDDQIIPPGCKFYLVGQLKYDKASNPRVKQAYTQEGVPAG